MLLGSLASLLAIAATSLAGPLKRTTPVQLKDFSASLYSNNTLGTINFIVYDQMARVDDHCHLSWNPSGTRQPGIEMNKCAKGRYQFGFRYGLGNIEDFTLDLQQISSSETAYQVINADAQDSQWKCTHNPDPLTKERCECYGHLAISV